MRGPAWYITDPTLDFWERLFYAIVERSKYDLFSRNRKYQVEASEFFKDVCGVEPEKVKLSFKGDYQ